MTSDKAGSAEPSLLFLALNDGVPKAALIAALIVGTVLNLINQGDVLWGEAALDVPKLLLTYCVPYCVATYGAVTAKRRYLRAATDAARPGK
jgi:hypothetical protein